MENIKTLLELYIRNLEQRLTETNTKWARGYYKGQRDAYKLALLQIDTEIFIKDLQQKADKLSNGGK